jgi:hypothetical protein
MCYMFRPIVVIVRYIVLLESPFFLSTIHPYTGQCLHIGSVLYKYFVSLMPLCYKMYSLMELNPSWEAANCAAAQELPNILWNWKVHYRVH